jgi:hypothetical protein
MALLGKMVFKGKSGRAYRFRVYPFGTRLRKVSGVYIVGNRSQNTDGVRDVVPLFVGHTADFSEPFTGHRKAGEFTRQGADCICLQADAEVESRQAKEQDLIAALKPVCND